MLKKLLFNLSHWCFKYEEYEEWMYYFIRKFTPDCTPFPEFKKQKLQEVRTSGSTGEPRRFFIPSSRIASSFALVDYRFKQIGFNPKKHKFLKIWYPTTGHSVIKLLKERLDRFIRKEKFFSYFDLVSGKKTIDDLVKFIQKNKPDLIEAYAGGIIALSSYILENKIDMPKVQWIVTGAGMVRPEQHELIKKAFNCKYYDRYGCSEFGEIAHQLPNEVGYVPNPCLDIYAVEFPYDTGKTGYKLPEAPDGRYEVFITDNRNSTTFNKYRMKDIIDIKNGRIIGIYGRTETMYEIAPDEFLPTGFFYQCIKDFIDIKQWQVIIEKDKNHIPHKIVLTIKTEPRELKLKEQKKFMNYLCGNRLICRVSFEKGNFETVGRRKKTEEIIIKK